MRGGKCCFCLVQHSSGHPEDQSTLRDWESGEGPRESRRTDEEAEDLVYGWTVFEDVKEIRLGRLCMPGSQSLKWVAGEIMRDDR